MLLCKDCSYYQINEHDVLNKNTTFSCTFSGFTFTNDPEWLDIKYPCSCSEIELKQLKSLYHSYTNYNKNIA